VGLSTITFLGDNTRPILQALAAHVAATTGVDIEVVPTPSGSSRRSVRSSGGADLTWACGFLTVEMIDAGDLDVEIIAAPVFAGEDGPTYHSVLIARQEITDPVRFRGTVAVNERESWSGHHALGHHFEAIGSEHAVAGVRVTGSHRRSVEAVAVGEADLAAIDHTVWAHLAETTSVTAGLMVIDRTRDWPAPPFALHRRVAAETRRRLIDALTATTPGDVEGLTGIVAAARSDYHVMRPDPLVPA
jgi:ABC-type phosphate/phosphonate transport system substrate-binding protein